MSPVCSVSLVCAPYDRFSVPILLQLQVLLLFDAAATTTTACFLELLQARLSLLNANRLDLSEQQMSFLLPNH